LIEIANKLILTERFLSIKRILGKISNFVNMDKISCEVEEEIKLIKTLGKTHGFDNILDFSDTFRTCSLHYKIMLYYNDYDHIDPYKFSDIIFDKTMSRK